MVLNAAFTSPNTSGLTPSSAALFRGEYVMPKPMPKQTTAGKNVVQ